MNYRTINSIGIGSSFLLAAFPIFLSIAPMMSVDNTYAEWADCDRSPDACPDEDNNSGGTETALNAANVDVNATVALTATDAEISITPSASGPVFATGSSTVTISTNGSAGYYLTMSTTDGNSLVHEGSADPIPSITTNTTGTNMAASSWGYLKGIGNTALVSGTQDSSADLALIYKPIPGSSGENLSDTDSGATETVTVNYGVKAASDLPSGKYSREITFTAVAKVKEIAEVTYSITYLHENGTKISDLDQVYTTEDDSHTFTTQSDSSAKPIDYCDGF